MPPQPLAPGPAGLVAYGLGRVEADPLPPVDRGVESPPRRHEGGLLLYRRRYQSFDLVPRQRTGL
eukprot:17505-Eustigmatos_ZCMA.PRE.1